MQNLFMSVALAVIGYLAGALVNYCADVLPWKRQFTRPFCHFCQETFSWQNYLLWPRRCPGCTSRRSLRVWVVEIGYVLIALALWNNPPAYLGFWLGLGLLIYFGVVVVIDIEHRLILHPVSIFGAGFAALLGMIWRLGQAGTDAWWYAVWTTLAGGAVGFGLMWILYVGGEYYVRFLAKRRGQPVDEVALGFGDVNLSGVLGLLLGWPLIVTGLFFAVLIGGFFSLLYLLWMVLLRRQHLLLVLPYGPFLVAGAVLIIYFRDILMAILT